MTTRPSKTPGSGAPELVQWVLEKFQDDMRRNGSVQEPTRLDVLDELYLFADRNFEAGRAEGTSS